MEFEWDDKKAISNFAEHGVTFDDAARALLDPHALVEEDLIYDHEQRWRVLGLARNAILVVIHTIRDRGGIETNRIISARQANRGEKRHYERENN